MSLPDMPSPWTRIARFAVVVAAALALTGCLRPLYGPETATSPSVQSRLAAVIVDPLPERLGHYLVQELRYELDGSGQTATPRYRLTMTVSERVQAAIVSSTTGRATSATLTATASFTLTPVEGGPTLVSGTANASASYDRTQQRFAAIRAARDAEIRVARALAEQIRSRVAAHFATQS